MSAIREYLAASAASRDAAERGRLVEAAHLRMRAAVIAENEAVTSDSAGWAAWAARQWSEAEELLLESV